MPEPGSEADEAVRDARRSEVAESFRYARAFYDGVDPTGPAAFERNRQAIIDVIALAYRDGRASERAKVEALVEAYEELERAVRDLLSARGNGVWGVEAALNRLDAARAGRAL